MLFVVVSLGLCLRRWCIIIVWLGKHVFRLILDFETLALLVSFSFEVWDLALCDDPLIGFRHFYWKFSSSAEEVVEFYKLISRSLWIKKEKLRHNA